MGNLSGQTLGHRAARDALQKSVPFKPESIAERVNLDLRAALDIDDLFEANAARVQVVCELHWQALIAAQKAGKDKTFLELSQRFVGYTVTATQLWEAIRLARRKTVDGELDYEQVLERDRD